jgi:hypothetical protein
MDKLSRLEKERKIILPEVYKEFYNRCSYSVPEGLTGTDLLNHYPDLHHWANELIKQDGIDNFLEEDDFVFMMHQGYVFWYFKADGNPDPTIYGYHEKKLTPDNLGSLSAFVKEYTT